MPYSQRYLFNAIPDTNHNANRTNPNRYSKGNPNPTNPTRPTNSTNPTDPTLTLILDTVVNKAPTSAGDSLITYASQLPNTLVINWRTQ